MGIYLNPGNEGFRTARNGKYVDKSGMISLINRSLDTKRKLSCVSRPRRFGKSMAAQMLCAYYDKGCSSFELFQDLAISKTEHWMDYLNKYNIIYLDMAMQLSLCGEKSKLPSFTAECLLRELREMFPSALDATSLSEALDFSTKDAGCKFIAIIDEWDAPIRDNDSTAASQKKYLEFLRLLFKSSSLTDKIFAGAFMTGILPIKKDGSQSAISDFREYTMLSPGAFSPFVGFTEAEVKSLCEENTISFDRMRQWYDGYAVQGSDSPSVYNPNSVMEAIERREFQSYWHASSAADSLLQYVNMGFDGLPEALPSLLGGVDVPVNVRHFQNDLCSFQSRDDVLTLLIHFGYLSYNVDNESVRIPNDEIRIEFTDTVRKINHADTLLRVRESDRLIQDTVEMREEAVARQIEKVHREEFTPLFYNNEQSLRSVIRLAYFSYRDEYAKIEELPGGTGYADIVFLPKKGSNLPALVVELKWMDSPECAINQIKNRHYPDLIRGLTDNILLVGISYNHDDKEKKHFCKIMKYVP